MGRLLFVVAATVPVVLALRLPAPANAVDEVIGGCQTPCVTIDTKTAPGTQSVRSVPVGMRFTVDIVVRNEAPIDNDLGRFYFELGYDQTKLTAPFPFSGYSNPYNPAFVQETFSPLGSWACGPPTPQNDADPDPAVGRATLACLEGSGTAVSPNAPYTFSRVTFDAIASGTSMLTLSNVATGNGSGIDIGSCAPTIDTPATCIGATINVCPVATIFDPDFDHDGMSDACDDDDDNDALGDAAEAAQSSSNNDNDSDDDGVKDPKEWLLGLLATSSDTPADGWCSDTVRVLSVNGDPIVNAIDLLQVAQHFGVKGDSIWDVDANGTVNAVDQLVTALKFGSNCL